MVMPPQVRRTSVLPPAKPCRRADSLRPRMFTPGSPPGVSTVGSMPGLPKVPAAENIDVDENGKITGLF